MNSDLPELIGEAPAFAAMLRHVSALAPLNRPILVVGERGTGKELVASRLHFLSARWDQPFIKLNCAALSEDLLDSELFGHEAGAFTGALRRHPGRFERADRGSLFLDEIASASLRIQEKLLRVIEYGELERVGGDRTLHVDVRLIAAANVDLPTLASQGGFRLDLLDRLAFDVIHLPPLRARHADISLLSGHFAGAMARELGMVFDGFSATALAKLEAHGWPGNVRELKNTVERSLHRHHMAGRRGPIDEAILDPFASPYQQHEQSSGPALEVPPEPGRYSYRAHMDRIEHQLLHDALLAHNHNQRAAASALELSYDQFRRLLRKARSRSTPA